MAEMDRAERAQALQGRILSSPPAMPIQPTDLHADVCSLLAAASEDGWLRGGSAAVWQRVKLSTNKDATFVINFGGKNQKRNTKRVKLMPHLERFDGAWFDFALTGIADMENPIRLDSYSFEIRLPLWQDQPTDEQRPHFLRFDLNPPGHANEARCHMHIGSDLFSIPSPWMGPLEILDEIVYGARPSNVPPPD